MEFNINIEAEIAGVHIGDEHPVRLMGVLNIAPESFYKGSIVNTENSAIKRATEMVEEGADFLDIGAVSTAPGVKEVSEVEELERLRPILKSVLDAVDVPVSVDTFRSRVADEALKLGAELINDVSGFVKDVNMVDVLKEHSAPAIVMATKTTIGDTLTTTEIVDALKNSLRLCKIKGYIDAKIIIDPAIGRWTQYKTSQVIWT